MIMFRFNGKKYRVKRSQLHAVLVTLFTEEVANG